VEVVTVIRSEWKWRSDNWIAPRLSSSRRVDSAPERVHKAVAKPPKRTPSAPREGRSNTDKLRILPLVFVCGLLPSPAFAQLTTIGPGTPGVTEYQMGLAETADPNFFTPTFTPIVPLQPGGSGLDFLNAAIGDPHGCLLGCVVDWQDFVKSASDVTSGFSMFDVHFSKPVSFVSALQMQIIDGNSAEVLAFNSANQLVGACSVTFAGDTSANPPGCETGIKVIFTDDTDYSVGNLSISTGRLDISTVLIGGSFDVGSTATGVKFGVGVPEPGTLSLLVLGLAGVGFMRRRKAKLSLARRSSLEA
jgi:hypothetical protein